MSTTLLQTRDYIRSFEGLTSTDFNDTLLTKWINIAQPNIMRDLVKLGIGYDSFIKQANLSWTTKFLTNVARASNTVTVSCTAHGLAVNDYVIVQAVTKTEINGVWKVATVPDVDTFTYTQGGQTIGSVADTGWVSKGLATAPTDLANTDDAIISLDVKFATTGASSLTNQDIYYKPTVKKTVEEGIALDPYNTNANSYATPSTTQPYYYIAGNISGTKSIFIRPANVIDARLAYRFKPTDLSAEADTLTLGDEYLDLLRIYVKRMIKDKEGKEEEITLAIQEYEKKMTFLLNDFQKGKETKKAEALETQIT